nr:hypothetical protein [Tanacetum cinerariifolium]
LHAEEELKIMIEGLDRSNEMIEKHLQEYEQSEAELTIGEKIDLISKLVYVEALQVKHHIINWEIYSEGKKDYWKIIMLGGYTAVYQFFVDMLKQLDREDLHQLWALVEETLSIRQATKDNEMESIFGHTLKISCMIQWTGSYMTHVVFTMCLPKIKRFLC